MSDLESKVRRFESNEQRVDQFVNGDPTTTWETSGGVPIPSIQKFFRDTEIAYGDAQDAALVAENARDAALAAAGPLYATEAEGRAAVADGESFNVQGSGSIAAYVFRRLDASHSELLAVFPSAESVSQLQQLIKENNTEVYETLIAGDGGILREYTSAKTADVHHEVSQIPGATAIGGDDGGVSFYSDAEKTIVGPLELRYTDLPGVHVVDPETGGILQTLSDVAPATGVDPGTASVLDSGVFFTGPLVGVAGKPILVHIPSMLADRKRSAEVEASISSGTSTGAESGNGVLKLDAAEFGSSATLALRDKSGLGMRVWRSLPVVSVASSQGSAVSPVVLLIGDSISNRQGAFLIDKYCREIGVTPTFIGTMSGRGANDSDSPSGPLGEGREGWRSGDFVYTYTDKCVPVAVGGEADYLTMTKAQKLGYNPFLRAATSGDTSSLVRNGYVFDVAFYLSRFALPSPDVVIYAGGTNDTSAVSTETIRQVTREHDNIIVGQIRAALPTAKVIRTLPGTAMDSNREGRWPRYIQIILGMLDSQKDLGTTGFSICPVWAMADYESGYAFQATTPDPNTGFSTSHISDGTHPIGSTRHQMFQALSSYVAAAATNFI